MRLRGRCIAPHTGARAGHARLSTPRQDQGLRREHGLQGQLLVPRTAKQLREGHAHAAFPEQRALRAGGARQHGPWLGPVPRLWAQRRGGERPSDVGAWRDVHEAAVLGGSELADAVLGPRMILGADAAAARLRRDRESPRGPASLRCGGSHVLGNFVLGLRAPPKAEEVPSVKPQSTQEADLQEAQDQQPGCAARRCRRALGGPGCRSLLRECQCDQQG
mmetsp:Transcript_10535/g.21773  ORF Transcript_10535/g.21773 Transcript_10535/m.21773 type:complete len:220 (-) Transcript_10535:30-689(-)